ncbi:MAG: ABC transporter ATP-binding protein [Deltaproteobacteria bacterium]|nr:ABC transporter ATP-binding protein [Deltaproteobacteria bacterium]
MPASASTTDERCAKVRGPVDSPKPIIQLEDVRKAYGQGKARQEVLRGISLAIMPGEMIALVGQSGCGKSTLLHVMGGLDRPDSGTVTVDGRAHGSLDDSALARLRNQRIGFVFQSFHLLDHLTVVENVALPGFFGKGEPSEERALLALDRVGLLDHATRRPTALSGGQKQRVAIARALYHRPAILLCDEPTGNLDSETGNDVIRFFQKLNREEGTTLVIVTHEERVSRAAGRVMRMIDGQVVDHEARQQESLAP